MNLSDRIWFSVSSAVGSLPLRVAFYIATAGTAFLFVRYFLQKWFRHRRISPLPVKAGQIRREFTHSMRTIVIFAVVHGFLMFAMMSGWTRMYRGIETYGWIWFALSIGAMIVLHDTYFYWTHRLMHHPRLFRRMHRSHHLSICTTPWAAYSFSALEAVVQAGIAPLIALVIPFHPFAFGLFMMWQMGFNVTGHCGYEIFPRRFMNSWLASVLNSVTHHGLHHEKVSGNFGLYFNFWDRIMGTNHANYSARFDQLTTSTNDSRDEQLRDRNIGLLNE